MNNTKEIKYEEISKVFKYEDGRLYRLGLKFSNFEGQWREVNVSKENTGSGYVAVGFGGKLLKAHRVIYSLFNKIDLPTDMQIDHYNGDRSDNHICNLELVTHRDNGQNQKCHREGNLVGATWHKQSGKWMARIEINGKRKYLGLFSTEQEAHEAYNTACVNLLIHIPNQLAGIFLTSILQHPVHSLL
jgi:hypothetical protein